MTYHIQVAFSTCTHWRNHALLVERLGVAFPAAEVHLESFDEPLSLLQFATFIERLEGGYHADRMPVVLRVPATFEQFADFLEALAKEHDFVASTVNVFDPSKVNEYFKVMNLKSLIPILRTAAQMFAPSLGPEELMEVQSKAQR